MRHPSAYLNWYVNTPSLRFDLRSSGLLYFAYNPNLGKVDLSTNYTHGNPETARLLAQRYQAKPENVFISSEGASGQNSRLIRHVGERERSKDEAVVEYPTYEPLLRQVEEHFPRVKRVEREEEDGYQLAAEALRRAVSQRTGLVVLTNPHVPTGALLGRAQLREIMDIANEHGFFVLCDEIYAEFDRGRVPTLFSVDPERGMTTTSFTKAYGLGGLKLGTALASQELVDELYDDVLSTIGNSSNLVQLAAAELMENGSEAMEEHKRSWAPTKKETEEWLEEHGFEYLPNKVGVTYWLKVPIRDTHKWTNEYAIPRYRLAAVPGAFFLFRSGYELDESNRIRLGLGAIDPGKSDISGALGALGESIATGMST